MPSWALKKRPLRTSKLCHHHPYGEEGATPTNKKNEGQKGKIGHLKNKTKKPTSTKSKETHEGNDCNQKTSKNEAKKLTQKKWSHKKTKAKVVTRSLNLNTKGK